MREFARIRIASPRRLSAGALIFFAAFGLVGTAATAATETRMLDTKTYERRAEGWVEKTPDRGVFRVNPEIITIKFRETTKSLDQEALHASVGGEVLRRASTGFIDIRVPRGKDVFDLIDSYRGSELVEIAEANVFGRYALMPDDPRYGEQWHLPIVNAPAAWDLVTGSTDVIVAILDSGTEFAHEDLGQGADAFSNIWLNEGEDAWSDPDDPNTGNGIDDDNNGYVDDWKGYDFSTGNNDGSGPFFHGTAVAGVTGAKTNNGVGVAGVAGGSNSAGTRLMVAGVGDNFPDGAAIDDAILYAAEHGARVVQLSLTVTPSAAIDAALEMAYDTYNVVIVCSSGNNGLTSVGYPSVDSHVISVGSTTTSDTMSGFSNHGADVEISAPGEEIRTTDLANNYLSTSGTSFSSPLVSGVIALMLAANPALTNVEVRQILRDTAAKVGGYDYDWNGSMPGHSFELGYGRVDALAAVEASSAPEVFGDGFESGNAGRWSSSAP